MCLISSEAGFIPSNCIIPTPTTIAIITAAATTKHPTKIPTKVRSHFLVYLVISGIATKLFMLYAHKAPSKQATKSSKQATKTSKQKTGVSLEAASDNQYERKLGRRHYSYEGQPGQAPTTWKKRSRALGKRPKKC